MDIMSILWTLFTGGKLKCQYYFDDTKKVINFPSMTANISIIKSSDVKGELGKIDTKRKITVPSGVSEKLIQLDQNQYNLAIAINALPKNERATEIKKYIKVLLEIHEIVSNDNNRSRSNIMNTESTTIADGTTLKKIS